MPKTILQILFWCVFVILIGSLVDMLLHDLFKADQGLLSLLVVFLSMGAGFLVHKYLPRFADTINTEEDYPAARDIRELTSEKRT